jgi:sensor histidine kinase YesM
MKFRALYIACKKNLIIPHLLFWLLSIVLFTVVLFYTRGDFKLGDIDLAMAISILVTISLLAVSVYINLIWLIPSFFNKRKYALFTILEIGNILLFIFLNYFISVLFEGGGHPNVISEFIAEFILVLIFLIVSTLLKFTRDSITLQEVELKMKEVEHQKVEAELRALKAQVNPHFFFNTLNSLYSLSLDKSDQAPELILKLSDLMRYVIYESKDDQVTIGKQLDFLRSYVYLEQLRAGDALEVEFEVKGDHLHLMVAPLLYIAFIENAFKHGEKDKSVKPFIRLCFDLRHHDRICFSIENLKPAYVEPGKMTGIGLTNVKKRLELLYPGRYSLNIMDLEQLYRVELTIFTP